MQLSTKLPLLVPYFHENLDKMFSWTWSKRKTWFFRFPKWLKKNLYLSPRNRQNEVCQKLLKCDNVSFFRSVPASKTRFQKNNFNFLAQLFKQKVVFQKRKHTQKRYPHKREQGKVSQLVCSLVFFFRIHQYVQRKTNTKKHIKQEC